MGTLQARKMNQNSKWNILTKRVAIGFGLILLTGREKSSFLDARKQHLFEIPTWFYWSILSIIFYFILTSVRNFSSDVKQTESTVFTRYNLCF